MPVGAGGIGTTSAAVDMVKVFSRKSSMGIQIGFKSEYLATTRSCFGESQNRWGPSRFRYRLDGGRSSAVRPVP